VRHRNQLEQKTRSSAIAKGPRDASCQLKSSQLPPNSAETILVRSPEQIEVMKLEGYSGTVCNKHVQSMNHDSIESLSLSYRCHKQTDDGRVVRGYHLYIPTTCCGEIF